MKPQKALVCLALSCCLASCGPGRSAPVAPPGAKSSPIAVRPVFARFAAHTPIGQHYMGEPPAPQSPVYWTGGEAIHFTEILVDVLLKQGYMVTAIPRPADDDVPPARVELRGTVTEVSENIYGEGNLQRNESAIVVFWELYDVSQDTVVFSASHRGAAITTYPAYPFDQAFQQSVEKLLSDGGFVAQLTTSPPSPAP